jgi:hydroxyacylglutathione hydrolase
LVKIHVLPSGPIQTVGYLLTDSASGSAVLIDAPGDIGELIGPILAAEQCTLRELWLTHGHWDHTQDAAAIKRSTGATVRAHRDDQALIETPEVMRSFLIPGIRLEGVKIDAFLQPGDRLAALGREFEVRHVPGHCPGNVLFYEPVAQVAFVGDALFNGGVGRWDLPGGDFDVLERSIRQQIYTLPAETTVYPGHGPRTTVAAERAGNPFVPAR